MLPLINKQCAAYTCLSFAFAIITLFVYTHSNIGVNYVIGLFTHSNIDVNYVIGLFNNKVEENKSNLRL